MLVNIILGTVIPWVILIYLYKRVPKIVLLFVPFGIALAFLINDLGQEVFWMVTPFLENASWATLPINIGYFPMLACLFAYIKIRNIIKDWVLLIFSISGGVALEFTAVTFGKVIYLNNWNLFYTSLTYLAGIMLTFFYLLLVRKFRFL
ncbi:hypothetical protein [Salipaludibacillus aurantiacus]|uniref:Uncharacterized protein n=1 Tax=Salipaludibacillus aurantiacus TaxID=1601833 RepID=A0A1H9QCR8_9BACI|nr:hypothetical protein [Salipaludibacillus aurantiacus]SER57955.1 hypothetical protein SAMN05518684_102140 [Salipaludibacillus aurantiacus]